MTCDLLKLILDLVVKKSTGSKYIDRNVLKETHLFHCYFKFQPSTFNSTCSSCHNNYHWFWVIRTSLFLPSWIPSQPPPKDGTFQSRFLVSFQQKKLRAMEVHLLPSFHIITTRLVILLKLKRTLVIMNKPRDCSQGIGKLKSLEFYSILLSSTQDYEKTHKFADQDQTKKKGVTNSPGRWSKNPLANPAFYQVVVLTHLRNMFKWKLESCPK